MIKKEIIIDDYFSNINYNKLEITDTSAHTITRRAQEKLTVAVENSNAKQIDRRESSNEKIRNYNNDDNINYYAEILCYEKNLNIKHLVINEKNIIKINSSIYLNLINLETLDLSHNIVGKISKRITNLQNLKKLKLNDNFISVLPAYLKELKHLEDLELNNNKIELIPSAVKFFPSLKNLYISQNLFQKLPMEIGFIKNLESLNIEKNEFTEIPTTLCYLDNLRCLTLEWFEFLDPELPKEQKDLKIIDTLKKFLKNKLLSSVMHIDLHSFIIKMSENIQKKINEKDFLSEDLDQIQGVDFNIKDIFYALNNNYFGVIKSFVNDNEDLIRMKDSYSGKNILYLSIQQNKKKIYDFLLSVVDISSVNNNCSILFRAVRCRNYELFLKLVKLGFSLEMKDLKGNNIYHVLFSAFNKGYEQCIQIANYLIEHNVSGYNSLNNDGWAPIHIAAKYSTYICFEWIDYTNKILSSQNKETFNINILGKDNYTAFHLACYAYKYSECIALLNMGSNLLVRGSDGKLPKNTTYNFFLTKMLFKKEKELFYDLYISNNKLKLNKVEAHPRDTVSKMQKILFTFDNNYDIKYDNKLTFINSERSKSEIICNNDKYSLLEKYQVIMSIALSNSKKEVVLRIKEVLKDINFKSMTNFIIICEMLNFIQNYNLYEFYLDLKNIRSNLDKANHFLMKEISKVILFLEKNKGRPAYNAPRRGYNFKNVKNKHYAKSLHFMKKTNVSQSLNKVETDIFTYIVNSNEINNNEAKKKFGVPGFQKLKEKKVQESITSIDFDE